METTTSDKPPMKNNNFPLNFQLRESVKQNDTSFDNCFMKLHLIAEKDVIEKTSDELHHSLLRQQSAPSYSWVNSNNLAKSFKPIESAKQSVIQLSPGCAAHDYVFSIKKPTPFRIKSDANVTTQVKQESTPITTVSLLDTLPERVLQWLDFSGREHNLTFEDAFEEYTSSYLEKPNNMQRVKRPFLNLNEDGPCMNIVVPTQSPVIQNINSSIKHCNRRQRKKFVQNLDNLTNVQTKGTICLGSQTLNSISLTSPKKAQTSTLKLKLWSEGRWDERVRVSQHSRLLLHIQSDIIRQMERVWRRVQNASRRAGVKQVSPNVTAVGEEVDGQHHHDNPEQRQSRARCLRSSQTIVCSCKLQPCPVHPVLIRIRKSQQSLPPNCDCSSESQPCVHAVRLAGLRRRRCECIERPCRHGLGVNCNWRRRRTPQGPSMLFVASQQQQQSLAAPCPHGSIEICDCPSEARLCVHPVRSQCQRRSQQRQARGQATVATEGPIKRVKCRVRRAADCAMARCSAELAMLQLHWELPGECAPCRPRGLTRRFCRRQHSDNELYRSNSFKFEKFERNKEDYPTSMRKQVSLCDDYSLPVDFVNKKRPVNVTVPTTTIQWIIPRPNVELAEIEVVEQYCDPKDIKSRITVEPGVKEARPVIHTQANRYYVKPCTDPSSSGSSCEDEETRGKLSSCGKRKNTSYNISSAPRDPGVQVLDAEWNLAESSKLVNDEAAVTRALQLEHLAVQQLDPSPTDSLPSRYPSPYYYGDLFKASTTGYHRVAQKQKQQHKPPPPGCNHPFAKYRKSSSLEVPADNTRSLGLIRQRKSLDENSIEPILSTSLIGEWDHTLMPAHQLLGHELSAACTCLASAEEDNLDSPVSPPPPCPTGPAQPRLHLQTRHKVRKFRRSRRIEAQPIVREAYHDEVQFEDEGEQADEDEAEGDEEEEMSRQRQIYETAFDCKIGRSVNDLDDLDRITNHSLLISQLKTGSNIPLSRASSSTESSKHSQLMKNYSLKDHRRKCSSFRSKNLIVNRSNQQRQRQIQSCQQQLSDQIDGIDGTCNLSKVTEFLQINSNDEKSVSSCSYVVSPPSTSPIPTQLHGCDQLMIKLLSTSNLSNQQQRKLEQFRLKDIHLPIKSLRSKESSLVLTSENSVFKMQSRTESFILESKQSIFEFKGRPAPASGDEIQSQQHRSRSQNLIREDRPIQEFKGRPHEPEDKATPVRPHHRQQGNLSELKLRGDARCRAGYSSTESMATSSSGGSMESLRSSTSEGNRSTSSSDSRHSSTLSSHSSDSGSVNCLETKQHQQHQQQKPQGPSFQSFQIHQTPKLHILSPISDKSSQEPASETSDNNRNNNSQKASPEGSQTNFNINSAVTPTESSFKKRRAPQNKNLANLAMQSSSSGDAEIHGSDSGISIESRAGIKCKTFNIHSIKPQPNQLLSQLSDQQQQQFNNLGQSVLDNEQDLLDLPFDMPKLRRRRMLIQQQQDTTTSGSATSVDIKDLPFDMPKLRRRLRCSQSTDLGISQGVSNQPVRDVEAPCPFGSSLARTKMTLNLGCNSENGLGLGTAGEANSSATLKKLSLKKPSALNLGLSLELSASRGLADHVDVDLSLERQSWYHGSITRIEAEAILRLLREGSYLVRNSESTKQDYSLSLKSARGFMHMRIQKNSDLNKFILGQFSKPFDSIPEMVRHFSINRLPIRGAEHMCLLYPVIAQLL